MLDKTLGTETNIDKIIANKAKAEDSATKGLLSLRTKYRVYTPNIILFFIVNIFMSCL